MEYRTFIYIVFSGFAILESSGAEVVHGEARKIGTSPHDFWSLSAQVDWPEARYYIATATYKLIDLKKTVPSINGSVVEVHDRRRWPAGGWRKLDGLILRASRKQFEEWSESGAEVELQNKKKETVSFKILGQEIRAFLVRVDAVIENQPLAIASRRVKEAEERRKEVLAKFEKAQSERAEYERQRVIARAKQLKERKEEWRSYLNDHPSSAEKFAAAVEQGSIMLGMPQVAVRIAWGEPTKINRTVSIGGFVIEQWIYRDHGTNLYFDDGMLVSWQD